MKTPNAGTPGTAAASARYVPTITPLSTAPSRDGLAFQGLSPDTCFEPAWLPVDASGHRTVSDSQGRRTLAHRIVYRLFVGPTPGGWLVLHRCGNAGCLNPSHLYLGDAKQNAADQHLHGTTRRGPRGTRNKLTPTQVQEIRAASGTLREIAAAYGVCGKHVSRIRNGHAWAVASKEGGAA